MPEQVRKAEHGRQVDDERHLDFIAGFPCTQFACTGDLAKRRHAGRPAVVCQVCEHVHYVLAED
jgi:hypothetical protein